MRKSQFYLFRNLVVALSVGLLLTSYGCSKSDDPPVASSSVVVTPSLGLINGANVRIIKPNSAQLGTTVKTDATGKATITFSGYSGPMIAEVTGNATATYFDEALGANVAFGAGEKLRAAVDSVKSQVGVTALTDIAVRHAEASVGTNVPLTANDIKNSNETIRKGLASEIADITAPPKLVSASTKSGDLDTGDASKYAAKLAALAKLAKDKSAGEGAPALAIAKQLAEDLKDGLLDGKNGSANVEGTGTATYTVASMAADLQTHIATYTAAFGNADLKTLVTGGTYSTIDLTKITITIGSTGGTSSCDAGYVGATATTAISVPGTCGTVTYCVSQTNPTGSAYYLIGGKKITVDLTQLITGTTVNTTYAQQLGVDIATACGGGSTGDATAPTVTAFAIPATSTSLTVAITTFTATDAVGVTGYLVTEAATAPAAADTGWTAAAPASYIFTTEGAKTLYAWAKDAAGNVSTSQSAAVVITLGGSAGGPVAGLMGGAIQSAAVPGLTSSANSTVSTFAGSASASPSITNTATGPATLARFVNPLGLTTDGTNLYAAELGDRTIRKIVINTGVVSTLASNVGNSGICSLTTDGTNLYVADEADHVIRKVDISTGAVTILAGTSGTAGSTDGTGTAASFQGPSFITTDNTNLYVSDGQKIRKVVISTGEVTTFINNVNGTFAPTYGGGASINFFGNSAGGLTTDGTYLYVLLDSLILRINIQSGATTILAGGTSTGSSDGTGTAAGFNFPRGITSDGTYLYVSDYLNQTIRKVAMATGVVITIAGRLGLVGQTEGAGSGAKFNKPLGITTTGTKVYIADSENNTIRAIQ